MEWPDINQVKQLDKIFTRSNIPFAKNKTKNINKPRSKCKHHPNVFLHKLLKDNHRMLEPEGNYRINLSAFFY